MSFNIDLEQKYPIDSRWHIGHDGFVGTVRGYYIRRDGKRGVVLQQDETNIVHVYGERWLTMRCTP